MVKIHCGTILYVATLDDVRLLISEMHLVQSRRHPHGDMSVSVQGLHSIKSAVSVQQHYQHTVYTKTTTAIPDGMDVYRNNSWLLPYSHLLPLHFPINTPMSWLKGPAVNVLKGWLWLGWLDDNCREDNGRWVNEQSVGHYPCVTD